MIVSSDRVLTPEGLRPATIHIEDGTIVDVGAGGNGPGVILPGLVDTHVHVNEPGRAEWEGFESATKAAAAGGITTIVDMPLNSLPVTVTRAAFEEKLRATDGKLWVDCGFWGGVVPSSVADLPDLLAAGVLGVKSFLIDSGIAEFPPMSPADLERAMPKLAGAPYLIHAELASGPSREVGDEYASFLASRPRAWENEAVELMIGLAERHRCRVHIVHLSSADALPALSAAKARGVPITAETCPHYLTLRAEEVGRGETVYKCCPPIREDANREALWRGLEDGTIDFIVSDHSPCLPEMKRGDFGTAWGGIGALEFSLPVVWTEARRRGIGIERVARWMSAAPAEFAGLRKGRIAPGEDADLIVFDPDAEFVAHGRRPTPYDGRRLVGVVREAYVRGEVVGAEGRGRVLRR